MRLEPVRFSMLLVALLLAGAPLRGQRAQVSFGGGLAAPTDNTADNGFQVQASLELPLSNPALEVRVDGQYDRFPFTYTPALPCVFPGCSPQNVHERMIAGTINGVLQLPDPTTPVTPYLVAGVGAYNHHAPVGSPLPSGTDLGVNAGGGVRFKVGAVHVLGEVRLHVVKNATNFVPVVLGLRF